MAYPAERDIRITIHGHSNHSDARSTVASVVEKAAKADMDMVAITDHWTVAGVGELYSRVNEHNQRTGDHMVAVTGAEITTKQGDVVFLKSEFDPSFIRWLASMERREGEVQALTTIRDAVYYHDAVIDLVHVGLPFAHSLSFRTVDDFVGRLGGGILANIGYEKHNWSGKVFGLQNKLREWWLGVKNKQWNLAEFGGSDHHDDWVIGKQYTVYRAVEASGASFLHAVRNRQTHSANDRPISPIEWFRLVGLTADVTVRVEILHELEKKKLLRQSKWQQEASDIMRQETTATELGHVD